MRSISRAETSSRSRSVAGRSRCRSASWMCPETDDSGVPISCASCAASWPSVARRTFEALSSRMSLSRRLSWPSARFFSDRSWVAFSISAPRRWLKARICASALESRSSIRLNPSDRRPTSSSVSTGIRRERSPFSTSRIAAASTSSGLPITRCVMRPETSVSPMTNTTAKMIEICSSVFSIDSTGPKRPAHVERRLPGTLQIDLQLDRLLLRLAGVLLAGEAERLADERREAGDLRAIAARGDDAARGGVRLAIDVEVEPHDAACGG